MLLSGKDNACPAMTPQERDILARSTQKLLRAAYASADADVMGKLRVALDSLVALGLDASATDALASGDTVTGKRSAGADGDDDDDNNAVLEDGSGQTTAALRASAIAAVDAAENNIKLKAPKGADGASASQTVAATALQQQFGDASTATGAGASSALQSAASADTELSSDLMSFLDPTSAASLKLVSVQTAPSGANSSSSGSSASGLSMKPLGAAAEAYADIATFALQRLLDKMEDIKGFHAQVRNGRSGLQCDMVVVVI